MRVVAHCELDAFCRRVLAKHWPSVPCHDDVTTREFTEGEADVICGGFPCQDVSAAGKRAGLAGTRSGLYRELVRAFRVVRPKILIVENVAALLSDGLGTVLGDLAESRDCGWIEWDSVPASAVGAPHERERVWIVAHATREQVGPAGQPRRHERLESGAAADVADADGSGQRSLALDEQMASASGDGGTGRPADPTSLGRGQGWPRRPPDSFARIRDEARRNAADPHGARLSFREGLTRDAWEKLTPAERSRFGNERQSIWPDEPALSGVDDGDAYWLDRVRATGNQVVPQIPQLIGEAIIAAERAA